MNGSWAEGTKPVLLRHTLVPLGLRFVIPEPQVAVQPLSCFLPLVLWRVINPSLGTQRWLLVVIMAEARTISISDRQSQPGTMCQDKALDPPQYPGRIKCCVYCGQLWFRLRLEPYRSGLWLWAVGCGLCRLQLLPRLLQLCFRLLNCLLGNTRTY